MIRLSGCYGCGIRERRLVVFNAVDARPASTGTKQAQGSGTAARQQDGQMCAAALVVRTHQARISHQNVP